MTIRSRRAGRARHFQNPRAIVRAVPPPDEQETPMRTTRDVTPERLALYCGDQPGVRVRTTSNGGWLVYGPQEGPGGSAVIPSRWEHGRGKENVLASLRAAGVDLAGLDADARTDSSAAPSPVNLAKLTLPGKRPALQYEKPTPKETTVPPTPPAATSPDLDTLLAMLTDQADTITALQERLDHVEQDLAALRDHAPGAKERHAQQRRDRIVEWFGQLPTGFRVTAGMVNENLQVPEEERRAYGESLRQLVVDGVLVANGIGERGGRHAHYQLASQPDDTAQAS